MNRVSKLEFIYNANYRFYVKKGIKFFFSQFIPFSNFSLVDKTAFLSVYIERLFVGQTEAPTVNNLDHRK